MSAFERYAPRLAQCALNRLALSAEERGSISHVLVTTCTGLYAPGLDFDVGPHLVPNSSLEPTMLAFMGCHAPIHHPQETQGPEQILSLLLFAEGRSAALVTADPRGIALDSFLAVGIPETAH